MAFSAEIDENWLILAPLKIRITKLPFVRAIILLSIFLYINNSRYLIILMIEGKRWQQNKQLQYTIKKPPPIHHPGFWKIGKTDISTPSGLLLLCMCNTLLHNVLQTIVIITDCFLTLSTREAWADDNTNCHKMFKNVKILEFGD